MSAAATNQSNQPNSTSATPDLQTILPKCLEIIGSDAKTAELRIAYDAPTNQTMYQYTLVWEDSSQEAEEKYRVAITEANKIMLALKAKKLKRSLGSISEKNSASGTSQDLQGQTENQYQELPFPPDLRSRSQQNEKSEETSRSSSNSTALSNSSASIISEPEKLERKVKKSSKCSRSSRKSVGCLDVLENVSVKVIVIDKTHFRGKLRPIATIATTPSTNVKHVLVGVLNEHFEGLPADKILESSSILFAFHDHNKAQKLRRVRPSTVAELQITNIPHLKGHVVLILDMVNYIEKGKKVPIQLEIDED